MITDEQVETALRKWFKDEVTWDKGMAPWTADQFRVEMRATLEAALTPSAGEAEPVAWLAEGPGWGRVFISKEAAEKLAAEGGTLKPLYTRPSPSASDPDDIDETYEIGKRDGYSEAVQQIDQLTGGDGEYRYCTDHDPDRHTPGPAEMIQRIVDRFEVLNLLDDATKTGRDQPDDGPFLSTPDQGEKEDPAPETHLRGDAE